MPKGELTLGEIRNLVRQHNRLSTIKGVDSKTRAALLTEITEMKYRVDHANKKIVRIYGGGDNRRKDTIGVSSSGEVKPNKTTKKKIKRKALISGGKAPVMKNEDEL
tara:strand:+ start:1810 stop:2130 length:321 start_codon:yes stop_codon:yes gene_type:complete